jgi:hypothetical protein
LERVLENFWTKFYSFSQNKLKNLKYKKKRKNNIDKMGRFKLEIAFKKMRA